jgi:hypothetical protein
MEVASGCFIHGRKGILDSGEFFKKEMLNPWVKKLPV